MLIGISPLISPELLATLCCMGHGDEIVFADAHFPGESCNPRTVRADGLRIVDLLDAVLPLFALDANVDTPLCMMQVVEGDELDPAVEQSYRGPIEQHWPSTPPVAVVAYGYSAANEALPLAIWRKDVGPTRTRKIIPMN